jgi:glycine cleavage system aminomethyltransferase T
VATGQLTSAAWSSTLAAAVALAYVWTPDAAPVTNEFLDSGHFQVDVGGRLVDATVHRRAPYDPTNTKLAR